MSHDEREIPREAHDRLLDALERLAWHSPGNALGAGARTLLRRHATAAILALEERYPTSPLARDAGALVREHYPGER